MLITLVTNNNQTQTISTSIYTEEQLIEVFNSNELVAITDIANRTYIINLLNVFLIRIDKINK